MFFDDLHILRTIDRLEQVGSSRILGTDLPSEVMGGQPITDDRDYRSFVRELEMARDSGFLTFRVMRIGGEIEPPNPDRMPANHYLERMEDFHLAPRGRDRARCRVYEQEPPDPGEDDGRPITKLTFAHIAEILSRHYAPDRLAVFLEDSGIPPAMIPPLANAEQGLLELFGLFDGLSSQRRVLRRFLGRWLAQDLHSGPNSDEERELLSDLARQGWYVREERLVIGERLRRAAAAPLLGDDLLLNLHPAIQDAARPYCSKGLRAAGVFEAWKTIEARVQKLLGSTKSGRALMSEAFGGDRPRLRLNQGRSPTDADEQEGFKFIFMGAMLGIRNPKAHARFEELEERRALDYLGLASLLMRRLDDVRLHQAGSRAEQPSEGG